MRYIKNITVFICLLIFTSVISVRASASEKWEKALYLSERDRTRLAEYLSKDNGYVEKLIGETMDKYNAVPNYSKTYVRYRVYDELLADAYDAETDSVIYNQENFDGLPVDALRYIAIPACKNGELIGEIRIIDWSPEAMSFEEVYPLCTPNSDEPCYSGGAGWMDLENTIYAIENNEEQANAELGYDIIESTGSNIQAIFFTDEYYNLYKTEQGYYVYPIVIREEEEKGNQAILLDDFIRALVKGNISLPITTPQSTATATSTPTSTPTPTPRPSKTAAATSLPTVTVSAATPSAEQTASPMLTAAASILPSPSAESNSSAADAVFIVLGVILCCAAAGGIVWAVMSARRKKAGK